MKKLLLVILCSFSTALCATDFEGHLERGEHTALGTLVSGVVAEVYVHQGQKVARGDMLVRLDAREFDAHLSSAAATYNEAKALYDEAKKEEARSLELYERTLASDHELDLAKIDRVKMQALMEQTKAKKLLAKIQLERLSIKAPFDGLVTVVMAVPGQMVSSRLQITPLVKLVGTDQMRAVVNISGKQLANVTEGMEVKVAVGEEWVDGYVSAIIPLADTDKGSYRMEVTSPGKEHQWSVGASTVIRFK